jgi:hypothetical protein
VLRATDRGAGAKADYVAWLATPAPGKGRFEVFDCSEGARFLFLTPGGRVQTVLQTGGVMGDSSVKMGGAGVWRQHGFQSSPAHAGAWFCYPSDLNASGDYALRGNFTIHWRRPDDETTLRSFAGSPTMLARKLRIRGGQIMPQNRRQRYRDAIDAGMQFMTTLTEKRDDGYWMYERWIVDQQGPRIYWGNDGQMLCARTFEHVYRRTRRPEYQALALGIAGRVVGYRMTKRPQYREVLDGLHRYLAARQHTSGAIKQADVDCVNLIYAQNWGPQGFCDAYEATGDRKFLDTGLRLADFLVRVQLVDADPHLHGAWVGSYNVAKDFPGGIMDDEGNLYDLYTSWGAGPIVYGLERLLPHAANAE